MPRKRIRKSGPAPLAPKEKSPLGEELLNPGLITQQLLSEMWGIFEQHFLTDLPFLNKIIFDKKVKQFYTADHLEDSFACLLLAFLALTTPFHDSFVTRSWPKYAASSTPIAISKQYADAARTRLKASGASRCPSIETTQTLLMIGLHEWRSTEGMACFLTVGAAVDCARLLGCAMQEDLDPRKDMYRRVLPLDANPDRNKTARERFIEAEEKRRTFWSCYIMDSYVSSGRDRPWKIPLNDHINLQLPCSEKAFTFGHNVRTMTLSEDAEAFGKRRDQYLDNRRHNPNIANGHDRVWEKSPSRNSEADIKWVGEDNMESLAWFIRVLSVYRKVVSWTCNVTRRNEPGLPWDPTSAFAKLVKELEDLKDKLPPDLVLSPDQTTGQIASRTHRDYVLIHSLFAVCDMALHREYIPLFPCDHNKPSGPSDGDVDHLKDPAQAEFWREDAEKCFKAAKDFLDLMWTCHESPGSLVQTPMTGFALFYVLQIVLWCRLFDYMDERDHLCRKRDKSVIDQNFHRAWGLMKHIRERLQMAHFWSSHLYEYWLKLKRGKKQWLLLNGGSPASNSSTSTEGRVDGLVNWLTMEKDLKEFGNHERDGEIVPATSFDDAELLNEDPSESDSPDAVKSENGDALEGSPQPNALQHSQFTAVNVHGLTKSEGSSNHATEIGPPHYATDRPTLTPYGYPQYSHQANGSHTLPVSLQQTVSATRSTYEPVQHLTPQGHAMNQVPLQLIGKDQWAECYQQATFGNSYSIQNFTGGNENAEDSGAMDTLSWTSYGILPENYNHYNAGTYNQQHHNPS